MPPDACVGRADRCVAVATLTTFESSITENSVPWTCLSSLHLYWYNIRMSLNASSRTVHPNESSTIAALDEYQYLTPAVAGVGFAHEPPD